MLKTIVLYSNANSGTLLTESHERGESEAVAYGRTNSWTVSVYGTYTGRDVRIVGTMDSDEMKIF